MGAGHDDVLFTTIAGIEAPTGARGRKVDRSFIILERGQTETHVEGQPTAGDTEVAREVAGVRDRRRLLHPNEESRDPVGLLVDRRVSARETIALAQRLPMAADVWIVTQERPGPLDASLPAAVTEQLEGLRRAPDWPSRSERANQIVARALARCPGHERFFERVTPGAPDADRQLREAVIAAAKNCSCEGVDLDALEAVLLSVSEAPPPYHAVPLRLRRKAKETLVLAPDATVEELVRHLPEGEVAVRWERERERGTSARKDP